MASDAHDAGLCESRLMLMMLGFGRRLVDADAFHAHDAGLCESRLMLMMLGFGRRLVEADGF